MHLPGSGITPFNVMELSVWWWRVYRAAVIQIVDEIQKANKANKG